MRGHFKRQFHYNDTHSISFSTVYFHLRHNWQFFRGYSPRRAFKRFETHLSSCAHRTQRAGAELGTITSFSVCMFQLRFIFVRSGAGGGEGELGSVLLFVRRKNTVQLFRVLCFNALHSFECLNWQGLKHMQMISFRDDAQQWPVNCPERLFG